LNLLANPGSSAVDPDLNWSQMSETVSFLCLAMAQIESTLTDSSKDVNTLTSSFTKMAADSNALSKACEKLENPEDFKAAKSEIASLAGSISEQMNFSVVAFQFYDRLSQKLSHVNTSLNHLGDIVGDKKRLFDPAEWINIQSQIRSHYSMPSERLMFDLLMSGSTIKEALDSYKAAYETEGKQQEKSLEDDDVELF